MAKSWHKTGEGTYSFSVDGVETGKMNILMNASGTPATCQAGDSEFTIRRTGFWNSSIDITGTQGVPMAKVYNEKWYANTSTIEYQNKKYKLVIRNNPLAEWAILDGNHDVCAYGLDTYNGLVHVRITGNNTDILFDFLLWYLFVPVATENMGDNFIFHILMTAQ